MANGTTIRRGIHDTENPYVMLLRTVAQNKSLSYEAVGLLTYLLSKPGDWEVKIPDLVRAGCKRGRVYTLLTELAEAGHCKPAQKYQDKKGHWQWTAYEIYEVPRPCIEKPDTDEPYTEKRDTLQSTESQSKDKKTVAAKKPPQRRTPEPQSYAERHPEMTPEQLEANRQRVIAEQTERDAKRFNRNSDLEAMQTLVTRILDIGGVVAASYAKMLLDLPVNLRGNDANKFNHYRIPGGLTPQEFENWYTFYVKYQQVKGGEGNIKLTDKLHSYIMSWVAKGKPDTKNGNGANPPRPVVTVNPADESPADDRAAIADLLAAGRRALETDGVS